ncbi:hypothetical protein Ahy_A03g014961 [Arachis hypogaea]|uniref:BED-type domain-containing protein n=1 Tax=Arachis hypogaea TaxID=3818 RepID=A0A445DZB1_ARAHY|nr:hypothetical protein Ahy_A03g014961 [Arachis hypogaea]
MLEPRKLCLQLCCPRGDRTCGKGEDGRVTKREIRRIGGWRGDGFEENGRKKGMGREDSEETPGLVVAGLCEHQFTRLSGSASSSLVLWLSLSIFGIWIAVAFLLPFTDSLGMASTQANTGENLTNIHASQSGSTARIACKRKVAKNALGSRTDVGWKHGISVGEDGKKIQCKYCHQNFLGGVYRLKHNLAGTQKDVGATTVSDEVKKQMWDVQVVIELLVPLRILWQFLTLDDDEFEELLQGPLPLAPDNDEDGNAECPQQDAPTSPSIIQLRFWPDGMQSFALNLNTCTQEIIEVIKSMYDRPWPTYRQIPAEAKER